MADGDPIHEADRFSTSRDGIGHVVGTMGRVAIAMVLLAVPAGANPIRADALDAFARNCFSPYLTGQSARTALAAHGRYDFYDLAPFSDVSPSPATTSVAAGTDRRCALAFDGDHGDVAAQTAIAALTAEGIMADAPLPAPYSGSGLPGTTLLAARFLNPSRIAVVHTGTRPGPNGTETFLTVERLTPEASAEAAR